MGALSEIPSIHGVSFIVDFMIIGVPYRSAGAEDLKLLACYRHTAPLERESERPIMIQNSRELEATLARIERFQKQIEKLREMEDF